ncbi:hypothetical protein CDAR_31711 [Caerostris darwini]|uniref:Galectin n=1 Tax=Caerostris darwini TaxID=1538125 RepID=A0AAV4NUM5_9ARAC|nr:hypothetical protein CDAR_31711 [Caerostris darwini]
MGWDDRFMGAEKCLTARNDRRVTFFLHARQHNSPGLNTLGNNPRVEFHLMNDFHIMIKVKQNDFHIMIKVKQNDFHLMIKVKQNDFHLMIEVNDWRIFMS